MKKVIVALIIILTIILTTNFYAEASFSIGTSEPFDDAEDNIYIDTSGGLMEFGGFAENTGNLYIYSISDLAVYYSISQEAAKVAEELDINILIIDSDVAYSDGYDRGVLTNGDIYYSYTDEYSSDNEQVIETYSRLKYEEVFDKNTDGIIIFACEQISYDLTRLYFEFRIYTVGDTDKYMNNYAKNTLIEIMEKEFYDENVDWNDAKRGAYEKFFKLLPDFVREAKFFMPYNYLNPYKSLGDKIIELVVKVGIVVAVIAILRMVLFKKTKYHIGRKAVMKPTGGVCIGCGSIYDKLADDMECPFCEKNNFLKGNFEKAELPSRVGSFILNKEDFVEMYEKYVADLKLFPKKLKRDIVKDNVKAIYLKYNKYENVAEDSDGMRYGWGNAKGTNYRVYEDFQYVCLKNVANLPHMNSRKINDIVMVKEKNYIPDNMIKELEPFEDKKEDKIKNTGSFGKTAEFFAPVWRLDIKYGKKLYTFFMNGQNGTIVGELIIDCFKVWAIMGGGSVAIFVVLSVIFNLFALL